MHAKRVMSIAASAILATALSAGAVACGQMPGSGSAPVAKPVATSAVTGNCSAPEPDPATIDGWAKPEPQGLTKVTWREGSRELSFYAPKCWTPHKYRPLDGDFRNPEKQVGMRVLASTIATGWPDNEKTVVNDLKKQLQSDGKKVTTVDGSMEEGPSFADDIWLPIIRYEFEDPDTGAAMEGAYWVSPIVMIDVRAPAGQVKGRYENYARAIINTL